MKIAPHKVYKGDVVITKENQATWKEKLAKVEQITGYVRLYSNATLTAPALKQSGDVVLDSNATLTAPALKQSGYVRLYSNATLEMERVLFKAAKGNKLYLSDRCSDWLLSQKGDIEYHIIDSRNNVIKFPKDIFDKVRKDELMAAEVFSIENMEQRRVAYERMDKVKMKDLPNLKVLEEVQDDGHGYPMKVVSFNLDGFKEPFLYLNCFCPSTGREYYLETRQKTCAAAKAKSFGFDKIEFDEEW